MINIIIRWFLSALVVLAVAYILPGVGVASLWVAVVVALVMGLIHTIMKPIILFLTLPLTIITLGLFTFVVDALLVMLAAFMVPGFSVSGFWWALLFAFILSIANSFVKKQAKS
jgi:putative membrane protein